LLTYIFITPFLKHYFFSNIKKHSTFRKHRSLDGAQFMREFDQATRHAVTHYPEYYQYDNYVNQIYEPPPPPLQQQPAFYSPQGTAAMGRGYDMLVILLIFFENYA
jgi:hypothetical protein